jgi:hypothetical protein
MPSFTTEELLQFLYKETSPEQTAAITAALSSDWSLREKLSLLSSTQQHLNEISYSPRQQSVDFILNYAEKTVEEWTESA